MSSPQTSIFRRRTHLGAAGALLAALALQIASLAAGTARAQMLDAEPLASVRSAAEALLRSELRDVSYGVHVSAAQLDPRLHLAHCASALAAARGAGGELGAHVTVRVSCNAPETPWSVYVPVNIESDVNVLVLRQSALRGTRLTAAQVSPETRRLPGLAVGYVTDVATLDRHTLSRALPAGTVLTADALLADLIVRQGQQVTLVASSPGISVRAMGKALEDGREGARVRVQNLGSLKVVQGVVDVSGVIEITP